MASIVNDPNGRKRILFVAPDGKRKTIRLGKIDRKTAEGVCRQVEHLLSARLSGQPIPRDTAVWLASIGEKLRQRLVRVGLVDDTPLIPTVAQWCQDYLDSRSDWSTRTRSNVLFAVRLLVERLGGTKLDKVTSADAEALVHALERRYAPNTVRRVTGYCRQIFTAAVKSEVISRNPFQGLAATVRPNRSRSHYVSREGGVPSRSAVLGIAAVSGGRVCAGDTGAGVCHYPLAKASLFDVEDAPADSPSGGGEVVAQAVREYAGIGGD